MLSSFNRFILICCMTLNPLWGGLHMSLWMLIPVFGYWKCKLNAFCVWLVSLAMQKCKFGRFIPITVKASTWGQPKLTSVGTTLEYSGVQGNKTKILCWLKGDSTWPEWNLPVVISGRKVKESTRFAFPWPNLISITELLTLRKIATRFWLTIPSEKGTCRNL